MKKEVRTAVYDDELHIEAYRFEGGVQPLHQLFQPIYQAGPRYLSGHIPGQRYGKCHVKGNTTAANYF